MNISPSGSFHKRGHRGQLPTTICLTVLHWFTGNIGFHHVHHLAASIPNYRLKQCFNEVAELHHVTRLTLWTSLRSARLHLWDEVGGRLVSFGQARRLLKRA